MMKSIYELGLHEWVIIKPVSTVKGKLSSGWKITRVPGGWIYYDIENKQQSFVPWSDK